MLELLLISCRSSSTPLGSTSHFIGTVFPLVYLTSPPPPLAKVKLAPGGPPQVLPTYHSLLGGLPERRGCLPGAGRSADFPGAPPPDFSASISSCTAVAPGRFAARV